MLEANKEVRPVHTSVSAIRFFFLRFFVVIFIFNNLPRYSRPSARSRWTAKLERLVFFGRFGIANNLFDLGNVSDLV